MNQTWRLEYDEQYLNLAIVPANSQRPQAGWGIFIIAEAEHPLELLQTFVFLTKNEPAKFQLKDVDRVRRLWQLFLQIVRALPDKKLPAPRTKANSFKTWTVGEFIADIRRFSPKYSREMLNAFYSFWKEPDPDGKMKFQLNKTWDTAGRLATWKAKDATFRSHKSTIENGPEQSELIERQTRRDDEKAQRQLDELFPD